MKKIFLSFCFIYSSIGVAKNIEHLVNLNKVISINDAKGNQYSIYDLKDNYSEHIKNNDFLDLSQLESRKDESKILIKSAKDSEIKIILLGEGADGAGG